MNQVVEDQQPSSSSSSSRKQHKKKPYLILFFIILFATIISSIIAVFTVLKHDIESEHRAIISNPDNLVKEICRVAPYHHPCEKSMSSLYNHRSNSDHDIHLSDVLRLSIRAAYDELYIIRSLPKELGSTYYNNSPIVEKELLADCQSLLQDSLEQLNKSWIMIPEYYTEPNKERTFFNNDGEVLVITNLLVDLISGAGSNLRRCIYGLRRNGSLKWRQSDNMRRFESSVLEAKAYVMNALAIVEKRDVIYEKVFKPMSVSNVFASLVSDPGNNYVALVFFCSQYMMLMLLVCVLLRVC